MTASYYEKMTGEPFKTTVIYPNRFIDRSALESLTDLKEEGSKGFIFLTKKSTEIARGYIRIVYGDHGPYIEFLKSQILWDAWKKERSGVGYYDTWYPRDKTRVKLYDQRYTVKNLKNPPNGPHSYKGYREEGYADYRPGRLYISPYDILVVSL